MNQYFKFQSDSDLGVGVQYIEFDDRGWAIRQAECYGERWFNSIQTYHKELGSIGLCDQQLTEAGMKIGDYIDIEEFEWAWRISSRELVRSNFTVNKLTTEKSQNPRYALTPWVPALIQDFYSKFVKENRVDTDIHDDFFHDLLQLRTEWQLKGKSRVEVEFMTSIEKLKYIWYILYQLVIYKIEKGFTKRQ